MSRLLLFIATLIFPLVVFSQDTCQKKLKEYNNIIKGQTDLIKGLKDSIINLNIIIKTKETIIKTYGLKFNKAEKETSKETKKKSDLEKQILDLKKRIKSLENDKSKLQNSLALKDSLNNALEEYNKWLSERRTQDSILLSRYYYRIDTIVFSRTAKLANNTYELKIKLRIRSETGDTLAGTLPLVFKVFQFPVKEKYKIKTADEFGSIPIGSSGASIAKYQIENEYDLSKTIETTFSHVDAFDDKHLLNNRYILRIYLGTNKDSPFLIGEYKIDKSKIVELDKFKNLVF